MVAIPRTYEIEVPLEGAKLFRTKVLWKDNVRKLSGVINSECFSAARPRDYTSV